MSDRAASLAGRALLALLLMIGFYVLALAIAGALVAVPALEVIYLHRLDFRIAMVCLGGAGLIVWSVLPRPDRFEPPGPRLSPAGQPRLFRVLREVAAATGQAMPVDVYLVANVNAFVTQRGGIMGAFSKRVMGLGLPLMQALTVGELRAVLAHEFGHFYGGDTKLGPWVHKTRVAIGRTIQSLRAADSSVLHLPFEWYGALFLRITHAVSRAQEYAADALAARAVGAGPLASGLKKVRGAAVAFESFWAGELHPALNGGFRPPMMQGFARFMDAAAVRRSVDAVVDQAMAHDAQDPYDTHPPLPERVSALARLPGVDPRPDDDRPAVSLLDDVDALEQALLVALTGDPSMVGRLRSAAWDALGDSLWVPQWRARRDALARARPGI
ncbi:MAG: M48 family metalloprotease, partial [Acidobacteriota bacterium]|nr:M48 family metalloprotease [Acidobacteriota bacterium]